MAIDEKTLLFAVRNIARHGDTDVFPFPFESHIFFDAEGDCVALLQSLDRDYDRWFRDMPPVYTKSLSVSGYSGFRSPTQIDPFWNAYLLALTLSITPEIEKARVARDRDAVFSYRHLPDQDKSTIFDQEIGWRRYHEVSVRHCEDFEYVLVCDISDFYARIYHHRLENALKKTAADPSTVRRIMQILSKLSDGVSYGLPIGGPASRILSELLLNRTDRLLLSENIKFCRFVDDFHLFARTREEAHSHLVMLSESLLLNEGLSLQKSKTRIMSREEFTAASFLTDSAEFDSENERQAAAFLRIRLRFDPYSPNAELDYEALRNEVSQFDIVGMLGRELRKSRVDETLARQLVKSIKFLPPGVREGAVLSLVENMTTLYPIFPTVALVLLQLLPEIDDATQQHIFSVLREMVTRPSYVLRVPVNLAFAVRVLAADPSEDTEVVFNELYKRPLDMGIKRDLILAMARRNADYWISNLRKRFSTLTPWERRALLVASYILEDEGAHWRRSIKGELAEPELLVLSWASARKGSDNWSSLI